MIELRFCPHCHKMFCWKLFVEVPAYCPNCEDGYEYHNERFPPKDFLDKIVLEKLDLVQLLKEIRR